MKLGYARVSKALRDFWHCLTGRHDLIVLQSPERWMMCCSRCATIVARGLGHYPGVTR